MYNVFFPHSLGGGVPSTGLFPPPPLKEKITVIVEKEGYTSTGVVGESYHL